MKKLMTIVLLLVCITGLVGCNQQNVKEQNKNILTLDAVIELAAKGEELTWSDFEQYQSVDIGSGIYVLVYEIDETFELRVSGTSMKESPNIRLLTKANTDNYIDIKTEDVREFIKSNIE